MTYRDWYCPECNGRNGDHAALCPEREEAPWDHDQEPPQDTTHDWDDADYDPNAPFGWDDLLAMKELERWS